MATAASKTAAPRLRLAPALATSCNGSDACQTGYQGSRSRAPIPGRRISPTTNVTRLTAASRKIRSCFQGRLPSLPLRHNAIGGRWRICRRHLSARQNTRRGAGEPNWLRSGRRDFRRCRTDRLVFYEFPLSPQPQNWLRFSKFLPPRRRSASNPEKCE